MNEQSDASLVAQTLAGDKAAFAALVDRHRPRLRHLLLVMVGDGFEADDLAQESFLQAFLGLSQLRQPERFGSWVCGIGVNLARMRLRQRRRWLPWESWTAANGNVPDQRPLSPERAAEEQEMVQRLQQAIAGLPPAEREAILLVYLDGFSHQETAERVGVNAGAVKVRVHRGRRRLRDALGAAFDDATPRGRTARKVEVKMIEVAVIDVMGQVADNGSANAPLLRVALLKEKEGERALPVWVGPSEGDDIARQINSEQMKRPVAYDLMKTLLELGRIKVQQVIVSRLHETIFYGALVLTIGGKKTATEVDCRPSDAVSLALRLGAPIYVAAEVMEEAGIRPGADGAYDFQRQQEEVAAAGECETLAPSIMWRSLLVAA